MLPPGDAKHPLCSVARKETTNISCGLHIMLLVLNSQLLQSNKMNWRRTSHVGTHTQNSPLTKTTK